MIDDIVEELSKSNSVVSSVRSSYEEGDNSNRDNYEEASARDRAQSPKKKAKANSKRMSIKEKVEQREKDRKSKKSTTQRPSLIEILESQKQDEEDAQSWLEQGEEEVDQDEAPNEEERETGGWKPRKTQLTRLQRILLRADNFWEERAKPGGWDGCTRTERSSATHVKGGTLEPRTSYGGKWHIASRLPYQKNCTPMPQPNSVHTVTKTTPKITGSTAELRPPRPKSCEGFRGKVQFPPRTGGPIMRPGTKVDYGQKPSYITPKITESTYTHGGRYNSRAI